MSRVHEAIGFRESEQRKPITRCGIEKRAKAAIIIAVRHGAQLPINCFDCLKSRPSEACALVPVDLVAITRDRLARGADPELIERQLRALPESGARSAAMELLPRRGAA